jgi:hypothetical protein
MLPRPSPHPRADAVHAMAHDTSRDSRPAEDIDFDAGGPADAPPRDFRARVLLVLWPAFMMAAFLEALIFSLVDPDSFAHWPAVAVYSLSFLLFWVAIAAASAITLWLDAPGPWQAN